MVLQLNASDAAPCSDNVKKEGDKVNDPCARLPTGFSTIWDWGKGGGDESQRERVRERGKREERLAYLPLFPFFFPVLG